jgi:three-Cys-motif partner protein
MPAKLPVVGPWAKEKLGALAHYLEFYTRVLKNQRWRTIYVDAFAGGGQAVVRPPRRSDPNDQMPLLGDPIDAEQLELIKGSPRVALDVANPFDRYVFIDPADARAAELNELKAEYGASRTIDIRQSEAARGIDWVLSHNISKKTHRGIAFLDPFGAKLEWQTISKLAETGLFEVVVNFALSMAIQRMLPNNGEFQPGWRETLDAYFGTPAWFDEVYQERTGLFATGGIEKRQDYAERLLALYRARLKQAFGHSSVPRLIRNTRGTPLYFLLWAGPNAKGLEGANYVLGMGEKLVKASRSG